MSRRSIKCLGVFFFVLAGALPVAAQYQGQVNVGAVVAPVTVRDDTGRIVTDLPMKRFHSTSQVDRRVKDPTTTGAHMWALLLNL